MLFVCEKPQRNLSVHNNCASFNWVQFGRCRSQSYDDSVNMSENNEVSSIQSKQRKRANAHVLNFVEQRAVSLFAQDVSFRLHSSTNEIIFGIQFLFIKSTYCERKIEIYYWFFTEKRTTSLDLDCLQIPVTKIL